MEESLADAYLALQRPPRVPRPPVTLVFVSEEVHPELELPRSEALRVIRLFGDAVLEGQDHFHVRFWEIS